MRDWVFVARLAFFRWPVRLIAGDLAWIAGVSSWIAGNLRLIAGVLTIIAGNLMVIADLQHTEKINYYYLVVWNSPMVVRIFRLSGLF